MKKFILLVSALLLTNMAVMAQSSMAFEKGYRGNISLTGNFGVNRHLINNGVEITTSHGYSFGDGMYIGGGIGVNLSMNNYMDIPVYFDIKYNITDWKLSPYVDCRTGFVIWGDTAELAFMASPGVGFDYRKMSFRTGYKCEAVSNFKFHTISVGISVNF